MFRPTSTDIGILFLIRGVLMIPVNRIRRDAVQSLICRAFTNLDFSLTRRGLGRVCIPVGFSTASGLPK